MLAPLAEIIGATEGPEVAAARFIAKYTTNVSAILDNEEATTPLHWQPDSVKL